MKKVLIIHTVGFAYDGITSVILNYTRGMNRENISFFFPIYKDIHAILKCDLEQLGKTVVIPNRHKNLGNYVRALYFLLKEHFDVIHIHGNSGTMLIEVLIAKLCGVKKIIVHAHSTQTSHPLINRILKFPMMYLADVCIACSKASGDWLYGTYPHIVLNNAIDLVKFHFSQDSRENYRKEFCVKNEFLIGHIGYFSPLKNHFFLIDVFYEFHKLEPNSKLLLISDGPLLEQIKAKVEDLGIRDSIIFAGHRSDTANIYSAMDMFILPSLWEGLPLVVVEAQANSLPTLVSEAVPRYAKGSNYIFFKKLSDGVESWAQTLLAIQEQKLSRNEDTHWGLTEIGLNAEIEAEKLRRIYLDENYDG